MNKITRILIYIFFISSLSTNYSLSNETDHFSTLKYNTVKVRQGPSLKHPVKFIYKKKYLPLKIIDSQDNFKKIIDLKNNNGWIHISQLSKRKSAINIFDLSVVFKEPSIYSQPLARLEKGKMVTIKKCNDNWCKILIKNNKAWIKKKFLWGKF